MTNITKKHIRMVEQLASYKCRGLPTNIDETDLISAGSEGLVVAMRTYDESKGVSFDSYCRMKAEYAISDHLRNHDHLTRAQRKAVKIYGDADQRKLVMTDHGIAVAARLTSVHVAGDEPIGEGDSSETLLSQHADGASSPAELCEMAQNLDRLRDARERLPAPLAKIYEMRINQNLSKDDIATHLNITLGKFEENMRAIIYFLQQELNDGPDPLRDGEPAAS